MNEETMDGTDSRAHSAHVIEGERTGRRRLLQLAGAATAGALAASVANNRPAAALDGDPWRIGNANSGSGVTSLLGSPVQIWASPTNRPTLEVNHLGTSGLQTAFSATAQEIGIVGTAKWLAGVKGVSELGSDVYCGGNGRLRLEPHLPIGPPTGGGYVRGALVVDEQGAFWACTANDGAGVGTWERLTRRFEGYYPISPARVYDSRRPMTPMPIGVLAAGEQRTLLMRDGRDVDTGLVIAEKVVPGSATAVTFNLTVADTTGDSGFLSVNPGVDSVVRSSHVNWFGPRQIHANAGTVGVAEGLQMTVVCGGSPGAATHFIVDVTGYYV